MRLMCMVVHLILLWFSRKLDFLCTGSFLDSGCDFLLGCACCSNDDWLTLLFLAKRKKLYFNTMNRIMSTISYRPFTLPNV